MAWHVVWRVQEAQTGLLWVVEQIPGLVVAADMTPTLLLGYWPSFNVPFFPEVGGWVGGWGLWQVCVCARAWGGGGA